MYLIQFAFLGGFFMLAAAIAGIEYSSMGQHIGTAIAVFGLAEVCLWGINTMLSFDHSTALGVIGYHVIGIVVYWLLSYVLCRIIYTADDRQGRTMATTVAVGFVLFALIQAWLRSQLV